MVESAVDLYPVYSFGKKKIVQRKMESKLPLRGRSLRGRSQKRRMFPRNREMQQRKDLGKGLTLRIQPTGLHHMRSVTHSGKLWLRMAHWNVLMGHILDQTKVIGVFLKRTVIAYSPMGSKLSGIGYCIQKLQIKCTDFHVSYSVESELVIHVLCWDTIIVSLFQTHCIIMKQVILI